MNVQKVQQWYRQLQAAKIAEMQRLVLGGRAQEALEVLCCRMLTYADVC